MQFQKQLFGEPDKKVFCQKALIEKFVRDIQRSVFDSRIKKWFIAIGDNIVTGKGSSMGLTEDLTIGDGVDNFLLEAMCFSGDLAQLIGNDLMNNKAIEIVEVKDTMIVIRGFGLTWTGEKKLVWFDEETGKWEVGIA
jgi:hypothetical protein